MARHAKDAPTGGGGPRSILQWAAVLVAVVMAWELFEGVAVVLNGEGALPRRAPVQIQARRLQAILDTRHQASGSNQSRATTVGKAAEAVEADMQQGGAAGVGSSLTPTADPERIGPNLRCGRLPWLDEYPEAAVGCLVLVRAQPAASCSHTHFVYADLGDGNCACAPPAADCDSVASAAVVTAVVASLYRASRVGGGSGPHGQSVTAVGHRLVFASFPYTGNTWIRNFWDIGAGVAAQAHYPELGSKEWSTATLAHGSPCGTNGGHDHRRLRPADFDHLAREQQTAGTSRIASLVAKILAEEAPLSATRSPGPIDVAKFNGCDLVSAPGPSDPVLIKTHHPQLDVLSKLARHYTSSSNVDGIVLTMRSDATGWCKTHGLQNAEWWQKPSNKEHDDHLIAQEGWMAVCAKNIAEEFVKFNNYWTDRTSEGQPMAGVPTIVMNFTEMAADRTVARGEFRALFEFAKVNVSTSRFELAAELGLRSDVHSGY